MHTIDEVRRIYSRTAARYDRLVRIFPLFGVRLRRYRREAVAALGLTAGDTVVELGCGTGLNFPLLRDAVGEAGRVLGVDLTPQMLDRARERTERHGWRNVELVRCDVADYEFPRRVSGVISTFALTLSPAYDRVIERAAAALVPGGRLVLLDLKPPDSWPQWLVRFVAWLNRPFAVTVDLGERHPWESVRLYLREVEWVEHYGGAIYLSVGERPVSG